jgi:hypothetical protein
MFAPSRWSAVFLIVVVASLVVPAAPAQISADDYVTVSEEDAEEKGDGSIDIGSQDLDFRDDGSRPIAGTIFQLNVPQGTTIESAFVQFTADKTKSGSLTITITAEDADNASDFSGTTNDLSSRTQTANSVTWNPPGWTENNRGEAQQTPDLTSIVQEIIDRPGWESGNQIAILYEFSGSGERNALSADGERNVRSSEQRDSPELIVTVPESEAPDATVDQMSGQAGWRMLAPPLEGITVADLADQNLVQSIDGGKYASAPPRPPNLYDGYDPGDGCQSDEAGESDDDQADASDRYDCPDDFDTRLQMGEGFLWYIYDRANVPETDPLPFTWQPSGLEEENDVIVGAQNQGSEQGGSSDNNDEDALDVGDTFHLLGNPYNSSYDLSGLNLDTDPDGDGRDFSNCVQVWNPNKGSNGGYEVITRDGDIDGAGDDEVAVGQGFFVERIDDSGGATRLTFQKDGETGNDPPFYGAQAGPSIAPREVVLRVTGRAEGGTVQASGRTTLYFAEGATRGPDAFEATALTPLATPSLTPGFVRTTPEGASVLKAQASLPHSPGTSVTLPVRLKTFGAAGAQFTVTWPRLKNVPEGWTLTLRDTQADTTVALREANAYTFRRRTSGGGTRAPSKSGEGNGKQTATASIPVVKAVKASAASRPRFELTVTPGALPVELTAFEGQAAPSGVRLTWKTASEQDNAGFRVERRPAGRSTTQWKTAGWVDGSGTTQRSQRYRFTDTEIPYAADSLTYRLRQVDTDGEVHYSEVVTVRRDAANQLHLESIAPNPAREQVTVRYALPSAARGGRESALLRIYDPLGRKVRTVQVVHQGGRHRQRLDVSRLPSGMYILRLTAAGRTRTEKFTIVR